MSTRIPDPGAAMRKKPRRARFRAKVAAIVGAGTRVLNRGPLPPLQHDELNASYEC